MSGKLISIATLKERHGLGSADAVLTRAEEAILAATRIIEEYLRDSFRRVEGITTSFYLDDVIHSVDGYHYLKLPRSNTDVISVDLSEELRGTGQDIKNECIVEKEKGLVLVPVGKTGYITIKYDGGYPVDDNDVYVGLPEDIYEAAVMLAKRVYDDYSKDDKPAHPPIPQYLENRVRYFPYARLPL